MNEETYQLMFTSPQSGLSRGFNILMIFGTVFVVAGTVHAAVMQLPEAFVIPAQAGTLSLLTLAFVRMYGRSRIQDLLTACSRSASMKQTFYWGIVGSLALPLVLASLEVFLRSIGQGQVPGPQWITPLRHNPVALALAFLVSGLLVPFAEEILYRGIVMGWLEQRFDAKTVLFAGAFIFAAAHFHTAALPHLVAMGLTFGFIYQKGRSLTSSLMAHAVWNTLTLIIALQGHA